MIVTRTPLPFPTVLMQMALNHEGRRNLVTPSTRAEGARGQPLRVNLRDNRQPSFLRNGSIRVPPASMAALSTSRMGSRIGPKSTEDTVELTYAFVRRPTSEASSGLCLCRGITIIPRSSECGRGDTVSPSGPGATAAGGPGVTASRTRNPVDVRKTKASDTNSMVFTLWLFWNVLTLASHTRHLYTARGSVALVSHPWVSALRHRSCLRARRATFPLKSPVLFSQIALSICRIKLHPMFTRTDPRAGGTIDNRHDFRQRTDHRIFPGLADEFDGFLVAAAAGFALGWLVRGR